MRKGIFVYLFFLLLILISGASLLGFMIARTKAVKESEEFTSFALDLPSKVLDIRGDLITEYSSEEKRELIAYGDISSHLIHALLAREDRTFYKHPGFSVKAILRAVIGKLTGRNLGGGSTITQQTAGNLYCDRTDMSIKRKVLELWWAIQMERRYSKDEIMELYLNKVYFGSGTIHGVSAAANFYCNHPAATLTPAESAILVVQLSSPIRNNPFEYPNTAREKQSYVLDEMVKLGYLTPELATDSFEEYWANFDYTRTASSGFYSREDRAPWFSEYVRRELENLMYGTMDYYTGGYTINTTCDLRQQALAEKYLLPQIERANKDVAKAGQDDGSRVKQFVDVTALIALCFDIPEIKADSQRSKISSMKYYRNELNPTLDMCSLMFNIQSLQIATKKGTAKEKEEVEKRTVEGALICFENSTGYITALIGGSHYNQANQLIRATQGKMQAGSTIKPLYYSAAIDARKITAATQLADTPRVFENSAGVQYIPNNYSGKWKGTVLAWEALALSLNIPAVDVMDRIGFDAAIDRIANLTDITDPTRISQNFPRVYPLALGISAFAPIEMAKAFGVFANEGRRVDPIAILNIENRNGNIILDPEKDLRISQKKRGSAMQVVSHQTAYIMTDMLKKTLTFGSLYARTNGGKKFTYKNEKNGQYYIMPMAGKTGTTQNWTDAWTIGYSPYYTTAVWLGFDRGGNSLGMHNFGAALAGPIWANFMYDIHVDKPYKDFIKPETGLGFAQVCSKSGLLPTDVCTDKITGLYFLAGTTPKDYCTYHTALQNMTEKGIDRLRETALGNDFAPDVNLENDDDNIFDLDLDADIERWLEDFKSEDLDGIEIEVIPNDGTIEEPDTTEIEEKTEGTGTVTESPETPTENTEGSSPETGVENPGEGEETTEPSNPLL